MEEVTNDRQVSNLLARAQQQRAVAATGCNEHSSRSHSVMRIKLSGVNEATTETSQVLPTSRKSLHVDGNSWKPSSWSWTLTSAIFIVAVNKILRFFPTFTLRFVETKIEWKNVHLRLEKLRGFVEWESLA